jgi:hypothetical protein
MFRAAAAVLTCAFPATSAMAVWELVVIEDPQPAQRIEGIALDSSGAPIAGVTLTDRTGWADL